MGTTPSVSSQTGLNFNQKTVLLEAGLKKAVSRLMASAGESLQSSTWVSLYSLGWQRSFESLPLCCASPPLLAVLLSFCSLSQVLCWRALSLLERARKKPFVLSPHTFP